jgi:DNA-binding CsgD family transcriptional regulator
MAKKAKKPKARLDGTRNPLIAVLSGIRSDLQGLSKRLQGLSKLQLLVEKIQELESEHELMSAKLALLYADVHNRALSKPSQALMQRQRKRPRPPTQRQQRAMALRAENKTIPEIAAIMGIKEITVETYLRTGARRSGNENSVPPLSTAAPAPR